jgi:hypothetical protein
MFEKVFSLQILYKKIRPIMSHVSVCVFIVHYIISLIILKTKKIRKLSSNQIKGICHSNKSNCRVKFLI